MSDKIFWINMKITGLDPEKDRILELACMVTERNLMPIANQTFHQYIHTADNNYQVVDNMDKCFNEVHSKLESRDIDKRREASISLKDAEIKFLEFIRRHQWQDRSVPLAGNLIWIYRSFIRKYMPEVDKRMHYRLIEISTVEDLCSKWNPNVVTYAPTKRTDINALEKINEDLNELKYYQGIFLKKSP